MEQAHIIQKVTDLFARKLMGLNADGNVFKIILEDGFESSDDNAQIIKILLLGIEEKNSHNQHEKIQQRSNDNNGGLIEYFVQPPTLFVLKYIVAPCCSSRLETYKTLGLIIKLIKEDSFIDVDEFDWILNDGSPVKIEHTPNMDLDKQMNIYNILNMEYRPSLFYQAVVGINSDKKEIFRRVDKRKISAYKK